MKHTLFICNTYSQFIISVHMKLTVFKDQKVSVILTDQTRDMQKVKSRLDNIACPFEEVFYIETKAYCSKKNAIGYFKDILHSLMGDKMFDVLNDKVYDEIVYYNLDFALLAIYDKLIKRNKNMECSRYEEGILSYNHEFLYWRLTLVCNIRKILGHKNPQSVSKYFYCFYPEVYKGKLKAVGIPTIDEDKEKLADIMGKCFEISLDDNSYSEKYIFFTSVYDFEGGKPIGEFEAVGRIADVVGKDNLLIKQHPRDPRNIYIENGFRVDKNSSIPWEAIQFQLDISNKVLLTVNSGSILSSALLFKNGAKAFFVYELCDLEDNELAQESISSIKKVLNTANVSDELKSVSVLHDEKELI